MNEAKALTLEAGKFYRTRDGKKALVGAIDPFLGGSSCKVAGFIDGYGLTTWTPDGCYYADKEVSVRDLVAEWVEPRRIKGWIAVWGDGGSTELAARASHIYRSLKDAREAGFKGVIAYVEIDVLEGDGLNGEAA